MGATRDRLLASGQYTSSNGKECVSGNRQFDARCGSAKQSYTDTLLKPPHLQTDGSLGSVEMGGCARKGEMIGHGDERAQKFGIEVGTIHKETLSSSLRLFHSLHAWSCVSMALGGMEWKL
jgi:hypothetical protein